MKRPLLMALLALPLSAGAGMYGAEYQACNQSTTIDIVECVRNAGSKWDGRLNQAYDALVERSEDSQLPALAEAQRRWVEYRRANCDFYAASGGSLGQIEAVECFRALTKARVCELQQANIGEAQPADECAGGAASGEQAAAPAPFAPAVQIPAKPPTPAMASSGKSALEAIRYSAGNAFLLMQNRSAKTRPEGSLHTHVMFEQDLLPAGGSAVFGWMEGQNQVVLLSHSRYLPSVTRATTTRSITFERMLTDLDQAPRYTMTCVWQQDEEKVEPALRVYAERDDANSAAKKESTGQTFMVSWIHIPASRAERAFAGRDYCSEISTTEKTSAPLWEEAVVSGR